MAGPLFFELAEDLAHIWYPSLLYTGYKNTLSLAGTQFLTIKAAPHYDRSNNSRRFLSWFYYFFGSLFTVYNQPNKPLLFIVSNPPFLGIVGLLFKYLRGQKYVILVYDTYPDVLIGIGFLKKGMFTKVWDFLNRIVLQNSSLVITIGEYMADNLERKFDVLQTSAKKIVSIPNWVDINKIKPLSKKKNWFAQKHNQVDKITVLYSGNMGNTHDVETILYVAKLLVDISKIHFLFIGEGAKRKFVEDYIQRNSLGNVTLLPFQPEETLPYSLSAGDIGLISYHKGTENCILPSKTYYYMAAGLALLVISEKDNDLSQLVKDDDCGINVKSKDIQGLKQAILGVSNNEELLDQYKQASRKTAEERFSRKNTKLYADVIRKYVHTFNRTP